MVAHCPMKPTLARLATAFAFIAASCPVRAASPEAVVADDFESTAVGAIPAGFTKTGAIGVAEGVAHSGKHALKVELAVKGGRYITLAPDKVAALGGEHWGRLYLKVNTPAPFPLLVEGKTSAIIHTTLVAGKAVSPLSNDPIEVRFAGFILNGKGDLKYIYNVQPKQRKEFATGSKANHQFDDKWTLLEWHADYATQSYQFFVNGDEVTDLALHKGEGKFEGTEIPAAFQTLSIGWTNYQPATGEGFTVWIDHIAVGKKRLGPDAGAK